jgi:hypothetical protein
MAQLQFHSSELDQRCAQDGEGAAFQQFIFELNAPVLPHLHPYPAGGKDGGIDHITDEAGEPRVVIECKFCGTDGIDEVRKRWSVTKGNLERNLSTAGGPVQSQYRPWYRSEEPIVRYIFTTSARLENPARVDELRDEIRDFFHSLSYKHPHLSHLSALVVEVHDWNYIEGRVPSFLRFRWFPTERPSGLRLLATEDDSATGFRAWLRSSTLPFYSRAEHLAIDPPAHLNDLPDEKALLGVLSKDSGTLGLVLVGRGGVGKTRLALEIGHTAVADGWTVWVVRRRLKLETIDLLAARMDAGTRVLLIFDYVETHPEFTNLVQHLADIVDDTDHCLRYVATCRSSYYNAINGADRQRVVALSAAKPANEEWLTRYRRATVEHILKHAGILVDEANMRACHDLPVLAAFLHWLHHRGRAEELETLLGEEDFGRWVIHRIQLSFPDRKLDHSLARLISLFPIPAAGRDALTDDERDLFYCLEQDGWIEREDDPTAGAVAWQTAHDVLADRVALQWLGSIGSAASNWCAELLREAVRFHALPSALRSLQRLSEHLWIAEAEWKTLLIAEINRAPDVWRPLRSALLRTSLLSAPSRLQLLASLPDVFAGAEVEGEFQSALGDLLRQLVETQTAVSLAQPERQALFDWIRRTVPHQNRLQYLRAWALRAAPEEFRDETLTFIEATSGHIATQYVICAWLYARQEPVLLNNAIRAWCEAHSTKAWFSFVVEAWLGGHGDPLVIQPFLPRWFARFLSSLQSSFVFSAWLEHANAPEVVKGSVMQWLAEHGKTLEARFVLGAWLEHANAPEVVKESVTQWLAENGKTLEACFVLEAWLEHANAPEVVKESVTEWLAENGKALEATRVLGAWLEHVNAPEVVKGSVTEWLAENGKALEATHILGAWLEHANAPEVVKGSVTEWLAENGKAPEATHVLGAWLEHANAPEVVEGSVTQWLAVNGKAVVANFVLSRWLNFNGAGDVVEYYVREWLCLHCQTFEEGSYVLRGWLRSGADSRIAEAFVIDWLNAHGQTLEAQFVLAAWLKAKNPPAPIAEFVGAWMRIHGETKECSHVLGPWLDQRGSFAVVRPFIVPWLSEYGSAHSAWHVITACLRADGERAEIRDAAIQWLALHAEKLQASFVLDAWLNNRGEPSRIRAYTQTWLEAHGTDYNATRIICAWMNRGGSPEAIHRATLRWLEARAPRDNTSWVLVAWLRAGGDRAAVEPHVLRFLANSDNYRSVTTLRRTWEKAHQTNHRGRRPNRF